MELLMAFVLVGGIAFGWWSASYRVGVWVLAAFTALAVSRVLPWIVGSDEQAPPPMLIVVFLPLFVGAWAGWGGRVVSRWRERRSAPAPRPEEPSHSA